MAAQPLIRPATRGDVPALLALGAEHAAFERLPHPAARRADALTAALGTRVHAWLATMDGAPAGYASATLDFSTLQAANYLHMDCLYVRDGWRGRAIGRHLWEAVRDFAGRHACDAVQWQTPWWNLEAARFYRRLGAVEMAKLRYVFPLRHE